MEIKEQIPYISEFRDADLCAKLVSLINASSGEYRFMEVCGGHTMAIQRFGIPGLLRSDIHLLSGPGCPVCVSPVGFIDHAIALSRKPQVLIATYGDLIRVPGSTSSLEKERAEGADIRIVYSILDALVLAKQHPDREIVFPAIGFETTAPATAAGLLRAKEQQLSNFSILSAHKTMQPALHALAGEGIPIQGYIAPGHVSVITGTSIYRQIPERFGLSVVIAGFEPLDLLQTIYMLIQQQKENRPGVEIQYRRAVKEEGNLKAQALMNRVFRPVDDRWRGLGVLEESGLALQDEFAAYDAGKKFSVSIEEEKEQTACICGSIMKGLNTPLDCPLFGRSCKPENPVGACMVSHEGACHAYYRYNNTDQ